MTNLEKYIHIFEEILEVDAEKAKSLKYQEIDEWDSVGHMELISEIEDAFDIEMEADDIIDFNSFDRGIEILHDKYQIDIAKA